MAGNLDEFILNTNLAYDGVGLIVGQLQGKTFGIAGFGTGDYVAEMTTATITENTPGTTHGASSVSDASDPNADADGITVQAGEALGSASGLLRYVIGIQQYTITLVDGEVLTQDDMGGRQLPVRVLDSSGGNRILFDFGDGAMSIFNTKAQIASISFPSDATQVSGYDGYPKNDFDDQYTPVCFTAGTLIQTDNGARPIEDLRVGDLILTRDNGLQPIRWIGSSKLSSAQLSAAPNIRPIRIKAGSLGKDSPSCDLTVSPQHRILVRSKIAQRMFGTDEVLVAAKHLLECEGIEIAEDMAEVEYFHMLFNQHEVIYSNGAETESLHTGPQALKSVGPAAQEEIFTIFPELRDCDPTEARPLARPTLTGREGRNFAKRSSKNSQPLFS